MRWLGFIVFAVPLGLFMCTASRAQQPSSGSQPEFAAASVKPSASDDSRTLLQVLPGGGLRVSGATLKFLITLAYEVRSFQILGGSGWISSDRFDVMAKSDGSTNSEKEPRDPSKVTAAQLKGMQDQMRPKLQALLAERFKLNLRRETREQPVYALVIGKGGTKFHQENGNFRGLRIGRTQLTGSGATLEMLTTALANQLGRPVLDRTRLEGSFDFKLEWADQGGASSPPGGDALPPADPNGPSIFTALQEQLGLKLESTKGPVEVLVIDQVERPSEN
jgi:bla regulator protein blaR1